MRENKNIILVISILIVIISIFIIDNYQYKEILKGKKEIDNNSSIAIMLQNEEGQYIKSTSNEWPKDSYAFNETYSSCENGSKLEWDIETGEVTLISNISDKCYVYFDKVDIYSVTVEVTGGHVDQSPKKVVAGREVSFTLTADEGYDLTKAKVKEEACKLSEGNTKLTVSNVIGPITCTVEIPKVTNLVTVNVVNGSSNPASFNVPYNESKTFTISANTGYDLTEAKVTLGNCSLSNNGATLTASNVINPMTCKVEIPKKGTPLNEYLVTLANKASGDGYLYYHDASLANGAGDGSYRYSGNEPNNYVCLGTKTASGGCDDNKHLYRIIGVIPVKVNGKDTQNLIKLIKSEYVTSEELGGWGSSTYGDSSSALTLYSSGAQYARIKNQSGINSFYWSGSSNLVNEWQRSTLYTTLNNATTGYLSKMGEWKDKIETVTWNIAGLSDTESDKPAKDVFTIEMNNSTTGNNQTTTKTVDAQVGLMYASDYGFAASKDNWRRNISTNSFLDTSSYNNVANLRANWLYNAVFEWTISRYSDYSWGALYVYENGFVSTNNVNRAEGVRPSFYLKSTVKYLEGEGSYAKPIFLG